jgi:hypothetical protein
MSAAANESATAATTPQATMPISAARARRRPATAADKPGGVLAGENDPAVTHHDRGTDQAGADDAPSVGCESNDFADSQSQDQVVSARPTPS